MITFHFPRRESAPPTAPVDVVRYYDRATRCWVGYAVDAAGNQIGAAQYRHRKDQVSLRVGDYDR